MKKIMNEPENVVKEMCTGIALSNPDVEFIPRYKIIKKKDINMNKVSLISGGGSGHEPAHAGYVGKGMLDAAVCGDVFASPSQIQVYQAIKETASNKGTLLIIKNYSGDMMNFKNGATLAIEDGITVDYVRVDDDIAVQDSLYTVGRRGVAGTVFVHKCAGAAAEEGKDLSQVKAVAEKVNANVRSLGFAYTSCTVPAAGKPTFEIGDDEMEYGVGIHGEPGIQREKIISSDEIAERMTDVLSKELSLGASDDIAVLINGFGASPLQELYVLNYSVMKVLHSRNIPVYRVFVGNYMTSIDMAGASVSFLKLDDELKHYLDAESKTPGFPVYGAPSAPTTWKEYELNLEKGDISIQIPAEFANIKNNEINLDNMKYLVAELGAGIIKNEQLFCELDSHAGDGDFGMSVAKGFRQLNREWAHILENQAGSISEFLGACSIVIMENCGGASGPIWGSAFRSACKSTAGKETLTVKDFADMMQAAVKGIQRTGERSFGRGAVVGDKTLIDALVPCADSWSESAKKNKDFKDAFTTGASAAVDGAAKTAEIVARMGRAGTVGERSIGWPDAGAYALGVLFTDLSEKIRVH